uniref:Putative RdRp n=1 Tax=Monilinia ourmiavirus A TaxID=2592715 RepID=A0A7G3KH57_9VIRU|nr:putative RdRp [Monilinia ourmiavirus A]
MAKQGPARQCRDFRERTYVCVSTSSSSLSSALLLDVPVPPMPLDSESCSTYVGRVKAWLASAPSEWTAESTMAFQSIKKLLPGSCRCMEQELLHNVAATFKGTPPPLTSGYTRFVRNLVSQLFPKGWDANLYESHCATTVPPLSGTSDATRSSGGSLGQGIDHAEFLDVVLGRVDIPVTQYSAQLTVVQSSGKPRPLSKQPTDALLLKPLHKSIYDRLSYRKWLLRGDVTTEKLSRAGFSRANASEGDVLVSGDYKSATDGLSIEVAEVILKAILDNAGSVPGSVKGYAMRSLRPNLYSLREDIDFIATVGQQMGAYLSFPLLCIQNYAAFRWACFKWELDYRSVPILINGDDILFQGPRAFVPLWMAGLSPLGLQVETTKTSVHPLEGTINSTLVRFRDNGVLAVVPTLKLGMLREADVSSLASSFARFVGGFEGVARFRAAHLFFRSHIGTLRGSQYSTYEMGFRGRLALRMTRRFGLPLLAGKSVPPPVVPHNVVLDSEHVVWVPADSLSREESRLVARELACWRFSVRFSAVTTGFITRCVSLASARPHGPSFCVPKISLTYSANTCECPSWRGWAWLFRQPVVVEEKRVAVPDSMYDYMLDERLPEYEVDLPSEVAGDGGKKK